MIKNVVKNSILKINSSNGIKLHLMFRMIPAIILFVFISSDISGQVTLKIEIRNLENNLGYILMDFRDGDDKEVKGFSGKITDKTCNIVINDLNPGKYSFKYFHDDNDNKKLDTNWIGIPKEGYGFSNNAKGHFGPPEFIETVFEVKKDTSIVCTAYYLKL